MTPDPRRPAATSLGPDDPMDDDLCLFVLMLDRDGREVPAALLERARAWADAHPRCRHAAADMAAVDAVLAGEPGRAAPDGFADRVLAAHRRRDGQGGRVLPMLQRLAVAAALLLAVTVGFDLRFPGGATAGDDLERDRPHALDLLRPDPFAAPDVDAGLEALLPHHAFGSGGEPAADQASDDDAAADEGR